VGLIGFAAPSNHRPLTCDGFDENPPPEGIARLQQSAKEKTMNARLSHCMMAASIMFLIVSGAGRGEEKSKPPLPPARKIPGITCEDAFPNGCVDCHIVYQEMNMDTRISTLMQQWNEKVEPRLLAVAQATAQGEIVLKGIHPVISEVGGNIPADCLNCHDKETTTAPPFAQMLHAIHLSGGEQNPFLTLFQGECTHCHKIDLTKGHWSVKSAPEP
jgi:hypothetical protein